MKNKKHVRCLIHRAVALTFIPNPNNLPTVNHLDGDKTNNDIDNLEWATYKRQMEHVKELSLQTYVCGENIGTSVYKESTIKEICRLLEEGYRNCDIVKICGVHRTLPSDIRRGLKWAHISKNYNIKQRRRGRLSVETVRWICERLEEKLSVSSILKLSTNKNITQSIIYHIKDGNSRIDISKDYSF